jgi:hypothetical protein
VFWNLFAYSDVVWLFSGKDIYTKLSRIKYISFCILILQKEEEPVVVDKLNGYDGVRGEGQTEPMNLDQGEAVEAAAW